MILKCHSFDQRRQGFRLFEQAGALRFVGYEQRPQFVGTMGFDHGTSPGYKIVNNCRMPEPPQWARRPLKAVRRKSSAWDYPSVYTLIAQTLAPIRIRDSRAGTKIFDYDIRAAESAHHAAETQPGPAREHDAGSPAPDHGSAGLATLSAAAGAHRIG